MTKLVGNMFNYNLDNYFFNIKHNWCSDSLKREDEDLFSLKTLYNFIAISWEVSNFKIRFFLLNVIKINTNIMIPAEHDYIVIKNERTLVVSLDFDRVKQGRKKIII